VCVLAVGCSSGESDEPIAFIGEWQWRGGTVALAPVDLVVDDDLSATVITECGVAGGRLNASSTAFEIGPIERRGECTAFTRDSVDEALTFLRSAREVERTSDTPIGDALVIRTGNQEVWFQPVEPPELTS
jgi:hypothetical protein